MSPRVTRKIVRNAARRREGIVGLRIRANRRGGACVVVVSNRHGDRLQLANAPTWLEAYRQVRSGFMKGAQ